MASGTQLGATHARVIYSDAAGTPMTGWTGDVVLPVVDESYGRDQKVFVAFNPFASHVVVADSFEQAYEVYVDAAADSLLIDAETLADYVVGVDSDGNPEYSEVEWTSGGEPVDTTYVGLYEVPLAAITWLYRPVLATA